ncbi:hypothetical protein PIROE2DRAFT_59336 [Piromyces sp. E2]|nr:hypothetical protein PIROE2DRAFT_59336 [Piromyces sp. E2]|eukprot:OUM66526.1 hypothetical protein PIROE2DRAFT_59336 [Piromyces sp. E2]
MKLTSILLPLLAVSTSYGHSLEHRLSIRAEDSSVDALLNTFSEECRNAIKENNEYYSCAFLNFTLENREEGCKIFLSEWCQNIIKDLTLTATVPVCLNDPVFMEKVGNRQQIHIDNLNSAMKFYCISDGDGKVCPGAEVLLKGQSVTNKNIDQNCASKKCLDGMMDYLKFKRDNTERLCEAKIINGDCQEYQVVMEHMMAIIDNKECSAKAKDDTKTDTTTSSSGNTGGNTANNNASSGANSIKVNITLLAIALTYIFF